MPSRVERIDIRLRVAQRCDENGAKSHIWQKGGGEKGKYRQKYDLCTPLYMVMSS